MMYTLEEIRERLEDRNLSEVSRRTGVKGAYLSAIRKGARKNPSYSVVKGLSDYLMGQDK